MQRFDDTTIIAYVDGELDADTAREVEQQMAVDHAVRVRVERLRAATSLLRGAYNTVLHEDVPTRLVAACLGSESLAEPPERPAARGGWQGWTPSLAMAATVTALAVGLSGGYILSDWRQEGVVLAASQQQVALNDAIRQTVNDALENQLSGTPVSWASGDQAITVTVTPLRTYQNSDGQYCREYRQELHQNGARQVREGLSCRTGQDQWEPRLILQKENNGRKSRTM